MQTTEERTVSKICSKCGNERPLDRFSKDRSTKDGLRSYCKDCGSRYWLAHANKNRAKLNAAQRARNAANPEKIRLIVRRSHFKTVYGVSLETLEKMKIAQEGKCAICKEDFKGQINLDHCHTTGKIRGLLCTRCNTGLGQFQDSVLCLISASQYLQKFQG